MDVSRFICQSAPPTQPRAGKFNHWCTREQMQVLEVVQLSSPFLSILLLNLVDLATLLCSALHPSPLPFWGCRGLGDVGFHAICWRRVSDRAA